MNPHEANANTGKTILLLLLGAIILLSISCTKEKSFEKNCGTIIRKSDYGVIVQFKDSTVFRFANGKVNDPYCE